MSTYPSTANPHGYPSSYGEAQRTVCFDLLDMLRMRLGIPPGGRMPFQYIQVFKATNEKYIIFIVQKDTGTILEDAELFPSDKLITQLRLIAE